MHIGRKNIKHVYTMAGQPLQVVDKEKDIGVIISDNLKPSIQCANASRRASAVLTQISEHLCIGIRTLFFAWNLQYQHGHLAGY